MTNVYHDSNELIVIDKVFKSDRQTVQHKILYALGESSGNKASLHRIYSAHEIWLYNKHTTKFEMYKNRRGLGTLLGVWLEDEGINSRCDAATINTAQPTQICFDTGKDLFLFKLKYNVIIVDM